MRYVLCDDLTRCATQLAFAEGDRMSSCLDLVRVPAQSLWIEWAEFPRRETLRSIPSLQVKSEGAASRRGGALIVAVPGGRSGHIRTFWSSASELAYVSPMVITFDLDRSPSRCAPPGSALWLAETTLSLPGEPAIEELLGHLRFSLDESWAAYYGSRCHTEELRETVRSGNLSGCAFDAPMLIAFLLLLTARDLLPRQRICHDRLNRIRRRQGQSPLLEHIELSAPLDRAPVSAATAGGESTRLSPRLHHVRGHIVRRGTSVYWRSPHLRGSARLGQVRSRTVLLTFSKAVAAPAPAVH